MEKTKTRNFLATESSTLSGRLQEAWYNLQEVFKKVLVQLAYHREISHGGLQSVLVWLHT